MPTITIEVTTTPVAWKRAGVRFGRQQVYTQPQQRAAKEEIRSALSAQWQASGFAVLSAATPVVIMSESFFQRPATHFHHTIGRGRELKQSAPHHHTVTPDADNLLKLHLDAMQGIVFVDDRQVYDTRAVKRWVSDSPPCIRLTITWQEHAPHATPAVAAAAAAAAPPPAPASILGAVGANEQPSQWEVIDLTGEPSDDDEGLVAFDFGNAGADAMHE